jgi:hypothetical protein
MPRLVREAAVGVVPIRDAMVRLKTVPPERGLARTAGALGISQGD